MTRRHRGLARTAMKELYPLSGVVAIPQTPFDDDDRIDLGSFARGVADRLAAGVDGLLYPVVASEVSQPDGHRAPDADARGPRAGRGAACRSSSARARTTPGTRRSLAEFAIDARRGRRPRPGPGRAAPRRAGHARVLPHGVRGADRGAHDPGPRVGRARPARSDDRPPGDAGGWSFGDVCSMARMRTNGPPGPN